MTLAEDELLRKAIAGDMAALSELLERHGPEIRCKLRIDPAWRPLVSADDVMQITYLEAFLRIPSISTQPAHKPDVERAAEWLREQLLVAGFPRADVMPTAGHPVVFAEWLAGGPEAPTVLVYGHYDVQPPDPVELWDSPPFEPTLVGDNLHCRGASDDN